MAAVSATVFDMDGVLVDTASTWRRVETTRILPAAIEGDHPELTEIRGLNVDDAYDALGEADAVSLAVDREEFHALYATHAERVYREQATLIEGLDSLLGELRAGAQDLGLVSASRHDWIEMVLDRFDLTDAFDVVVGAEDVETSKPAPACYRLAAKRLGVEPSEAIAVEDSPHGIEAARGAGLTCFALRGDGNADLDLSDADRVVETPDALRRTLVEVVS